MTKYDWKLIMTENSKNKINKGRRGPWQIPMEQTKSLFNPFNPGVGALVFEVRYHPRKKKIT